MSALIRAGGDDIADEITSAGSGPISVVIASRLLKVKGASGSGKEEGFGSHARGEAGPDSDYDLLVVVPESAPAERRESRLAYHVLRGTGVATDVIVVTQDYFEWMLGAAASLPATVEREGRLLYAA